MEPLQIVILILLVLILIAIIVFRPQTGRDNSSRQIQELQNKLTQLEAGFTNEARSNREENNRLAKDNRQELSNSLQHISEQSRLAMD
ncbi:MAG: hypothetical protein EOO03_05400, partial [Chitinophagaceae bacterium]